MRGLIAASLLSAAVALPLAASAQDAPFGGDEDRAYAETLWNRLEEARLAGDGAWDSVPYEGVEPHGFMLETFFGTFDVEGHEGLLSVKRNYGPEGVTREQVQANRGEHLGAVTVMFQREEGYDPQNQNWYWVKYLPDGSLDQTPDGVPMAGKVVGCIGCHRAAGGNDYLYTTDNTRR